MDANFWHDKWQTNQIGFHEPEPNHLLVGYFDKLSLKPGNRVFLPLCGKTLDIRWLLDKGYRVVGAELSKIAIEQLFGELGVEPQISEAGKLRRYSAPGLDVFVGDIFDVTRTTLGPVDAIYDRAALVALPDKMRDRYAAHLIDIADTAPQLLICFEYDQNVMEGPPFAVSNDEVKRHYAGSYNLKLLNSDFVRGGLKGNQTAKENVWLLKK